MNSSLQTTVLRQLSLVKGPQRYVFRYESGDEANVIAAMASLAEDRNSGFDWFDAAVLSYQLGRRLEATLDASASEPAGCAPQEPGRA